jgi:hypothetical protein
MCSATSSPAFRDQHGASLSVARRRAMLAIESCRTAVLGGHVERCGDCGQQRVSYNSCRNHNRPKCQGLARAQWLEDRQAELLEVPYFHVVFTVPDLVATIAFQNQARVYDILFRAAAETLRVIAADPEHRERKLARCRELLAMAPAAPAADPPADYRDRFEALTGRSLRACPHGHTGTMVMIDCIARPRICQPAPDTS